MPGGGAKKKKQDIFILLVGILFLPYFAQLRYVQITLCWWWVGLVLRKGGSLGVEEEVVEEFDFLSDSSHFFSLFVQDVFSNKLWSLKVDTNNGYQATVRFSTCMHTVSDSP